MAMSSRPLSGIICSQPGETYFAYGDAETFSSPFGDYLFSTSIQGYRRSQFNLLVPFRGLFVLNNLSLLSKNISQSNTSRPLSGIICSQPFSQTAMVSRQAKPSRPLSGIVCSQPTDKEETKFYKMPSRPLSGIICSQPAERLLQWGGGIFLVPFRGLFVLNLKI